MMTATQPQVCGVIDLEKDQLEPVADVMERVTGRCPSPPAIWRMRVKGARNTKLECYLVNGCWRTTTAAVAAFIRGQTQAAIDSCTAEGHQPVERDEATQRRLAAAGLV